MTVTQIDLDDDALREAMRLMGTTTKKETVNAALIEYVKQLKRLEAFDTLLAMGEQGDFDRAAEAHAAMRGARKQAWAAESAE
ncbi:type II toxin-antitoxin system VapB family antitoxin [Nocardia carnea]|uniref:Type II toxin-antitoxin system VapB family antitoxin n=1 Tax=Nocardia carnea TaxID=37328 RepID=A0ABW7TJA4_9NOCA|nr:type II toxin-antitoxin system VapB family antitoxin [Nocardia carnea]